MKEFCWRNKDFAHNSHEHVTLHVLFMYILIQMSNFRDNVKEISKNVSDLAPLLADFDASFNSLDLELRPQNFSAFSAKYTTIFSQIDKIIRESQHVLTTTDSTYRPSRPHTPIVTQPTSKQNSQIKDSQPKASSEIQ